MTNFFTRRYTIEDDPLGVVAMQPRCYITAAPPRRCTVHEWLVPRSCGLPKREQGRIFKTENMVMVEASLHDQGLHAIQDLFIAAMKVNLHGRDKIEQFVASLDMLTLPTFQQWIDTRYIMATALTDRKNVTARNMLARELQRTMLTPEYRKWLKLWLQLDGTTPDYLRLVGNAV